MFKRLNVRILTDKIIVLRRPRKKMTQKTACVHLRFITLMQRYSGKRDMDLDIPIDPEAAITAVIKRFNIPWKDHLEKSARIFINKEFAETFIKSGKVLQDGDQISFIPISGGG